MSLEQLQDELNHGSCDKQDERQSMTLQDQHSITGVSHANGDVVDDDDQQSSQSSHETPSQPGSAKAFTKALMPAIGNPYVYALMMLVTPVSGGVKLGNFDGALGS